MLNDKLAKELMNTATIQLKTSIDYKAKRFAKINDAVSMLLGQVRPKLRQQFNVPLPVLQGLYETVLADLDDPIQIKVKNNVGKNLKAIEGINTSFSTARRSLKPTARWDYKDRISRKFAVAYGRGILKYFSDGNPYRNTLEAVNPIMFHCQPKGGGILERHLFCGEEGLVKTKRQLIDAQKDGIYNTKGVELLIERAGDKEYLDKIEIQQSEQLRSFRALGLDPDTENFIGETAFNLVEWNLTHKGERYNILFDPYFQIWLKAEKLTDIWSAGYYPYATYATHEDDANFWSQSILADVLYPIADSMVTMFNQELTNRQKRLLNARLYDKDMIPNVQKLDEAQFRPDALVAVDTKGGTKNVRDAVFSFETPELIGTTDLINWLEDFSAKSVGIYQDIPQKGHSGKTNNLVYAQIQQLSKRIDYRSHSYTEAWGEIALRHVQGLKDNLTNEEAIGLIGVDAGFNFKKELREIKLDKDDIEIISTKAQAQEDALRKAQKEKALEMLKEDPGINQEWKRRHALLDIGGFEEDEVDDALDMKSTGIERDQLVMADEAIRDLIKGKEPEMCYTATVIYLKKLQSFSEKHRITLGEKFPLFHQWIMKQAAVATENTMMAATGGKGAGQPEQPQGQPQGTSPVQPTPQPTMKMGQAAPVQVNQ